MLDTSGECYTAIHVAAVDTDATACASADANAAAAARAGSLRGSVSVVNGDGTAAPFAAGRSATAALVWHVG